MLDPDAARRLILARCLALPGERVGLPDALDRYLAAEVRAPRARPPADTAAMDGYALRAADTVGASPGAPRWLRVVGNSSAGRPARVAVGEGEAVRISTGALLPSGADAVVMWEATSDRPGRSRPERIGIRAEVAAGAHVRATAEEWAPGDVLLPVGRCVTPATVGLLAAAGVVEVQVHRRPRVALLITGDELASADAVLERPELQVDSNGPMLEAYCRRAGAVICRRARLGDDAGALAHWLTEAASDVDLVISTGGTSEGETDRVAEAWRHAGIRTDLWKVAMRPGTPLRFGGWPADPNPSGSPTRTVLAFALSGNPFAASIQFELFVRPALEALAGGPALDPPRVRLPLETDRQRRPGLALFVRGTATGERAAPEFRCSRGRGGAVLRDADASGLLAMLPPGSGDVPAGSAVEALAEADALRGRTWRAVGPLPAVVSIRGASGSGKTCLIEGLLPVLSRHGIRVATFKHASHPVTLDTPGKDSFRHAAAGASLVLLTGPGSAAAFLYERAEDEVWPWLEWAAGRADLVLAEGFSRAPAPAVEIEQVAKEAFELCEYADGETRRWVVRRPMSTEGPVRFPTPLLERLGAALLGEIGWRHPASPCPSHGLATADHGAHDDH